MPLTDEQFRTIIQLIEDGELDDQMIELQNAMDERNARRKDEILRLVRSVWGPNADITAEVAERQRQTNTVPTKLGEQAGSGEHKVRAGAVDYVPDDGPAIPPSAADSAADWPSPIVSQSGGGGSVSPVADPMTSGGGGDPLGDDDPNIVSSGAQIGPA